MNPWLTPWLWGYDYRSPLSGDVSQDISPVTSLFSPRVQFNIAGDREIEGEIVTKVASYGKQLGLLSEAVLELAQGDKRTAIKELEGLVGRIEEVKERHKIDPETVAKTGLEQLKKEDPEALKRLLRRYKNYA